MTCRLLVVLSEALILIAIPVPRVAAAGDEGACCFQDGDCVVASEKACFAEGGNWLGPSTTCDHCPVQKTGACCIPGAECIMVSINVCDARGGRYFDGSCEDVQCPLNGDANGDGVVDTDDLLAVLAAWGACDGDGCAADLNGDGIVDIDDLLGVLGNWTA